MAEQEDNKVFQLHRVYLKDASFECPGAPEVFTQDWNPDVNVSLNSAARQLGESSEYEVEITVTVTAKSEDGDRTFYLTEVKQAGIFTLQNIDGEERDQLLGAYCPNLLFPYAREAISDLVSKGSFPQMVLQPINFEALYQQQREQQDGGATVQ